MKQYSLSRKAIGEYRDNYKKEYGAEISYDEASEQAIKLLRLFKIIYRPIKRKEINIHEE